MSFLVIILIAGGFMFRAQIKSDAKLKQVDQLAIQELGNGCRSWNKLVGLNNYLEYTTNNSLNDSARIYMDAVSLVHFKKASELAVRFGELKDFAESMFLYTGFNPAVTITSAFGAKVRAIVNYDYSRISDFCVKNRTPLR